MLALILAAAFALPPQKTDAVIGVSAVNLKTGERISIRGNERFPMGSVYKFPIALSVLRRLNLDEQVTIEPKDFSPGHSPIRDRANGKPVHIDLRGLLEAMLRDSDNTACDYFIRRLGAATITRDTGIAGIRIDREERVIGPDIKAEGKARYHADPRDTSTPDAMVELLSRELPPYALKLMTDTKTGPRRIKRALPEGATVAHKTGTMPGVVNDVGIVTLKDGQRIAMAIFTKRASDASEKDAEDDLAAVARAVIRELR